MGNIKGWVHCVSMQVVMNKYFLLNPEKNLVHIRLVVFEKAKKRTLYFRKMMSPSRRLDCRLQISFRLLETMVFRSLKLFFQL